MTACTLHGSGPLKPSVTVGAHPKSVPPLASCLTPVVPYPHIIIMPVLCQEYMPFSRLPLSSQPRLDLLSRGRAYVFDMSSASGYMGATYFQECGPRLLACHVPNVACHGVSISIVPISSVSCRVRILRVSVCMPCRGHPDILLCLHHAGIFCAK